MKAMSNKERKALLVSVAPLPSTRAKQSATEPPPVFFSRDWMATETIKRARNKMAQGVYPRSELAQIAKFPGDISVHIMRDIERLKTEALQHEALVTSKRHQAKVMGAVRCLEVFIKQRIVPHLARKEMDALNQLKGYAIEGCMHSTTKAHLEAKRAEGKKRRAK